MRKGSDVGVELGLHRGLHIDLGEDAEALVRKRAAGSAHDVVEGG